MQDFQKVKAKVLKLFSSRKGFSDEIIEAITATYIYLDENFPDVIFDKDIPDVSRFNLKSGKQNARTIANIYMNRIYNNVQKVETIAEGNANEYISADKKVVLCEKDIDKRINSWHYLNLNDSQKDEFKKILRAKILTHELIHAGSDNGISTGFYCNETDSLALINIINKYYPDSKQYRPDMSRLEEMMTEVLALNIVGGKNIARVSSGKISYACKNVDSSNAPIYSIAEYFVRTFPNIIYGKFVEPLQYLSEFSNMYEDFDFSKKDNFILKLNDYLRDLSKYANAGDKNFNAIKQRYELFQGSLLDIYNKTHKFDNKENTKKAIQDYAAFEIFACKIDGKIDSVLQEKLDKLMLNCKENCKKYNINFKDVYIKTYNEIYGKDENGNKKQFPPYYSLKNSEQNALSK